MHHLVVGGGGFVGRHLISALAAGGNEVSVIDRSACPTTTSNHASWLVHDFVAGPLARSVAAPDVVYCLVGTYRGRDAEVLATNVHALHHALSSLAAAPKLVVYVGAGSVYGECREVASEDRPPAPVTVYGLAKWLAESVLAYHAMRCGFPYATLRPTNVYGPGNRKNVFWAFHEAYKKHGAVTILGDGLQARNFVYIDDFVDLLLRVAEPARRRAVANQVFNVAGTETHTLRDVLRAMSDALGRDIQATYAPAEPGVLVDFRMSIAKAGRLLGWEPRVRFEEGARATFASYAAG